MFDEPDRLLDPPPGDVTSDYVGERLKLTILARKILTVAKRFFGVPPFHYYALADGIAAILAHATVGPLGTHKIPVMASPQLRLFDG